MERYCVNSLIGRGGFGKVYLVERRDDSTRFALKTTRLAELEAYGHQRALSELLVLSTNTSAYLVKCRDVFIFRTRLCVVTDHVDGGDLAAYMRSTPVLSTKFITGTFLQVCAGVRAMHANKLVHRDIKPANILLGTNGSVKVCDFGICKRTDEACPSGTIVGTPCYMSPEQVLGEPCDGAADVWGIGCVLFTMLYRKNPFIGKRLHELQLGILRRDPMRGKPARPTSILDGAVRRMMRKSRRARPTLDALMTEPPMLRLCAKHRVRSDTPAFTEAPVIDIPTSWQEWTPVVAAFGDIIHRRENAPSDACGPTLRLDPTVRKARPDPRSRPRMSEARWNGTKDLPRVRDRYAHVESKVKKHWAA